MTLTRTNDRESGASLLEYALLVALIVVVGIVAVTFLSPKDTLSDFYEEGSEDETATYQQGIDYDGTFCDFEAYLSLADSGPVVAFMVTGEDCSLEVAGDQFDRNGFRKESGEAVTEPGVIYALPVPVDYAFRLCHIDDKITDEDCRIFRLKPN